MFQADSTASARLIKMTYLKLYNRMVVQQMIDLMLAAHASRQANPHHFLSQHELAELFGS